MILPRIMNAALAAAALAISTAAALAGDIEGTVTLPESKARRGPRRAEAYPGEASVTSSHKRGPAIVFVDAVTKGAPFAPTKAKPRIAQKGRQFDPLATALLVGTTVAFPNEDDEHHNVFSRSKPKEMELDRFGKGQSRDVTFDKPGLVRLRCEVHSSMHGIVLVLENPYFAVADEDGKFTIKGVPPGTYKVHAFQEDYEPKDKDADPMRAVGKEVTVPASGLVRVDLSLKD